MPCGQPDTPTPIIRDISISSSEIFRKGLLLDSCEFIRRDKRELPAARDWAVGDKNEMWRRVSGIPSTMAIRKSRGSGNLDSLHSAVEKNVFSTVEGFRDFLPKQHGHVGSTLISGGCYSSSLQMRVHFIRSCGLDFGTLRLPEEHGAVELTSGIRH